jgi:hypothetical protein
MSLISRQLGPRIVERGIAASLTMPVYSAAGVEQTPSAATVRITDGAEVVIDTVAATSLGPPAAYSLLAATSQARGLSERWLEVWSLTIGGLPYTFRRSGYLVRHAFHPSITDTDLTALHADLLDLLPSGTTDMSAYRTRAAEKIERDLIKKGRRPHLIFDSWALLDAHVALSLHYVFRDFASSIGDGRYQTLATEYLAQFGAEFDSCKFSYDASESGTPADSALEATAPMIVLTSGPTHRRGAGGGYGIGRARRYG